VGNVDAHVTPPAANAIAPGQMVLIMGTSTCHVMNGYKLAEVSGMRGVVHGGITAGAKAGVGVDQLVIAGGLLRNPSSCRSTLMPPGGR
jgi:hypothetical protein